MLWLKFCLEKSSGGSMKAKRKISKERYVIVAIITLLIFLLGISFGFILDNFRVKQIENEERARQLDYASLQFQYLFLTSLQELNENGSACSALKINLEKTIKEMSKTVEELEYYKKESSLNKDRYAQLQRQYFIDNLKYWLLAKKSRKLCNIDIVTVLYFFSSKNCDICPNQGILLTYYKKIFNDRLLIFPLDVDIKNKEPVVDLMLKTYNITVYPTIVVNGEKHTGVVPKDKLKRIICSKFKKEQPECS